MNKKKRKKVLVVLGGTSGERPVSLESGKACVKALKKRKYINSNNQDETVFLKNVENILNEKKTNKSTS